jgi:hypothetical protein
MFLFKKKNSSIKKNNDNANEQKHVENEENEEIKLNKEKNLKLDIKNINSVKKQNVLVVDIKNIEKNEKESPFIVEENLEKKNDLNDYNLETMSQPDVKSPKRRKPSFNFMKKTLSFSTKVEQIQSPKRS